ncbi:hypothetical protein KVR01_011196 [Diaporthe batatas]|uniref:uncharacterized protein n=1 Tax=Diaporthe batatas TaxID=748121 RepID=UPI001D03776A|nr:uncharacterized protein KVR01_011196 [Diaporthe batatas]KAG8158753.1 hypothetical protein KVR01_011196 [Diaporthe batatas]
MTQYPIANPGPGRPRKAGGSWTAQENSRLVWLIKRYPNQSQLHWVEIAREHGTRDAKQCRERWDNHLKPGLNRDKITPEEGEEIMRWVALNGNKWAPLGRHLGRPENMVKNYYYQESKKSERERLKKERQEDRRRDSHSSALPASVPMSRDNSGNAAYPYGRRPQSLSPVYTPANYNSYRTATAPAYQLDQQMYLLSNQTHYHHYQSRRTSVASNATNPPSLASDHGSPAESPRAGAELPYPPGQFSLPSASAFPPQPVETALPSPHELVEGAPAHKRSESWGSTYSAHHSPNVLPIPTGFTDAQRLHSMQSAQDARPFPVDNMRLARPSCDHRWSAPRPSAPERPQQALSIPYRPQQAPSTPKKSSDPRLSISNLLS